MEPIEINHTPSTLCKRVLDLDYEIILYWYKAQIFTLFHPISQKSYMKSIFFYDKLKKGDKSCDLILIYC